MAVSFSYKFQHSVIETLETGVEGASDADIEHTGFNVFGTLDATTGVPVTKAVVTKQTLSGGALTIDLTAVTGTNGVTVDFSGLKIQHIFMVNGTAISAGVITGGGQAVQSVGEGAANGYAIFGAGNAVDVKAGQSIEMHFADSADDVAGADKNIDFTGAGSETFFLVLVGG